MRNVENGTAYELNYCNKCEKINFHPRIVRGNGLAQKLVRYYLGLEDPNSILRMWTFDVYVRHNVSSLISFMNETGWSSGRQHHNNNNTH
jgi:hypothetical protein